MPIEEAFSAGGLRRVVFSGVVLTAGVHPLIRPLAEPWLKSYDIGTTVFPLIEVVFLGLLISSATNWVYYLYEGFVGAVLTLPGFWFHRRRLRRLKEKLKTIDSQASLTDAERRQRSLVFEKLRDYPLAQTSDKTKDLETYVDGPTLLANIIATYELYPIRLYGIDGVFFWHHLIALAPDSIRNEFGETYALAESLVLASFAGLLVTGIHLGLLLSFLAGGLVVVGHAPISVMMAAALFTSGLISMVLFYFLALPVHREAGRIFFALVDLSVPKLAKCLVQTTVGVDDNVAKKSREISHYLGVGRRS